MKHFIWISLLIVGLFSCKKNNPKRLIDQRNFNMGFSTWTFGPNLSDINETYDFIFENGDIYSEQIDGNIPWEAWLNGSPLPTDFEADINGRANRKPSNIPLLLSVSLLNTDRSDLVEGLDGGIPNYVNLDDTTIENAYFKHLDYLIKKFKPTYIVLAMESNELLIKSPDKWEGYTNLMGNIRLRINNAYPTLKMAESVTLHNWFEPEVPASETYIETVDQYFNQFDFLAVSYYPFFKGQHDQKAFQRAFDFLHQHASKPIAFVETNHLANDLDIDALNLHLKSDEKSQNEYLETLLINAFQENYHFVIWWAHRDYDALWETFPDQVKDIGKLWRDTGLKDEDNRSRPALKTWNTIFKK